MLKHLYIRNYALIEKLEVGFENGLNIITGETGAGKSIIIDALSLILGERADTEAVRKDSEKSIVEGTFEISRNKNLKVLLEEQNVDYTDELILRREVSVKGQSRCFVNDSPITLNILKNIGDLLVDLHGQHEHQSILKTETHIDLLDDFGGHTQLVDEFYTAYKRLLDEINNLNTLRNKENQLREKRELYEFQVNEIDAVGPELGEEERLENELKILENAEKLNEITAQLYQLLYEGDKSAFEQLVQSRKQIENLARIDNSFDESLKEAQTAEAVVKELAAFINNYNSKIEFNFEKLENIRNKLGHISLLKKKYGGSIEALLSYRKKIGNELKLAENFEDEIKKLKILIEEKRKIASEIAIKLLSKRKESAKKVNNSIVKVLSELGIQTSKFETRIDNNKVTDVEGLVRLNTNFYETTPKGIDFVEFYISTNIGEDVKPLVKVASGGEISRIMLALKTILAKSERLPLLIFDEIDIGVSGRIAQAVGLSLKNLSKFHQIIAITHLPQIAGLADVHFVVEKIEDGKRSYTNMKQLNMDERIREVAKLMSGEEVTEAGLKSARELIGIK
ncbi:MAG: DNA repair protein RecN [Bacteroidetes bacterium]|nr:DNA repair protein RecN [Bacteroidota bacterium]MBU1421697.1 DNA repair protein RecN [Bacteroidota bacterium]MBU2635634.1 DNA repair protein RecN [Bacteroidota bacterium]